MPIALDTLPLDIVELICLSVVELASADFELASFVHDDIESLAPCQAFKSWSLQSLPLIHPLWRLPGTSALYRCIVLTTADEYKAFHQSLESWPTNRQYVRAITIRWRPEDFGGPDGYTYKVLGWWYEMEIEHLIRMCTRLESFDPGLRSIVMTQEGIEALADLTELRTIGLRLVDVERDKDFPIFVKSKRLESLRLLDIWNFYPATILQILPQIRKLVMPQSVQNLLCRLDVTLNLRELEVDAPFCIGTNHSSNPMPNLISLTIRKVFVDSDLVDLYLKIFVRLQILSVKLKKVTPCLWQSVSLVTMRFYFTPFLLTWHESQEDRNFIGMHIRRENLPRLKHLIQIDWNDVDGPKQCREILPKFWNIEAKDRTPGI